MRMRWISVVHSTRRDSLKSSREDTYRTVKVCEVSTIRGPFYAWLVAAALTNGVLAQSTYIPPPESTSLLKDIPFVSAQVTGEGFIARFKECDQHNTCEGTALKRGCEKDRNQNSTILKFPTGVIFYDAKMGIDADGSPLSIKHAGPTDQPVTKFRYNLPGSPSLDSDAVPYIAIPLGGFDKALGIAIGDIAAVVYDGKIVYALVGDLGPKCKIGEGSIRLHEALGHRVCVSRDPKGECTKLRDTGLERDILYFIFPDSAKTIADGLTPNNVNERLAVEGPKELAALKKSHK
jgi:hypothetical protein